MRRPLALDGRPSCTIAHVRRAALAVASSIVVACGEPQVAPDATTSDAHVSMDGGCPFGDSGGSSDAAAAPDFGPPADVGPRSGIGAACSTTLPDGGFSPSGTCDAGQLCLPPPAAPNGECAMLCSASMPCPSDAFCFIAGANGVCFARCVTDADCRVADGFHCLPLGAGTSGCLAVGESQPAMITPGHRGCDACYTTAAGPHQIAALAHGVFTEPSIDVSGSTASAAEGNVVVSPTTGAIVESYTGVSGTSAFVGTATITDGHTIAASAMLRDPTTALISDPVIAYTSDGHLHALFMSGGADTMSMTTVSVAVRLVMLDSTDDGSTWSAPHEVVPAMVCGGGICDKPWMTVGPGPSGSGESMYVAYRAVIGTSPLGLGIVRSDDGGATWTAQAAIATMEHLDGSMTFPALATLAVDATSAVHVVYWGIGTMAGANARLGDPSNRIGYRVSHDGGTTWTAASSVAGAGASVGFGQPVVAIRGPSIDVAYLVGTPDGAWDVMLATSTDDGASWTRRKVNDEPDECATHLFPWIAEDATHDGTHVTWLDDRFGPGEVAYAFCPGDPGQPCGANEVVSDAPFALTTSRDPDVWHGDYRTMLLTTSGDLWVGWSDTRTGSPAMYLAHGRP